MARRKMSVDKEKDRGERFCCPRFKAFYQSSEILYRNKNLGFYFLNSKADFPEVFKIVFCMFCGSVHSELYGKKL